MLTEAALRAASDTLVGLKENVLLGHLIPAGTGFKPYHTLKAVTVGAPPGGGEIDDEDEDFDDDLGVDDLPPDDAGEVNVTVGNTVTPA